MTPKRALLTRRRFIGIAAVGAATAAGAGDALFWEPHRLQVSHLRLSSLNNARFVVWSDFHYSGDSEYAQTVIDTINDLRPQFVCFLGDLIDNAAFQEKALHFVRKIRVPVFGIPGNHDYASRSPFSLNKKAFAETGGGWLMNQIVRPLGMDLELCGSAERYVGFVPAHSALPRVLLTHYPMTVHETFGRTFSLVLAGHSHGGQVRIPFYGPIALPRYVGRYDKGFYNTPAGPLYVNVGVGTYKVHARFNCPPEITVVEV